VIEIKNFTKRYGALTAVDDLSLSIEGNHICGFIGPNGAGKSTTIRFLATLLEPTSGDATIEGFSVSRNPGKVRQIIGFMPEEFGVYDGMRVWEYVDFFGAAYGIKSDDRRRVVGECLELVDLTHKKDDFVQSLSRGMKQRLCLAKSLVHDPKVLILDEPSSGLDPRARIEMKALLRELRNMGKTILISSHILSELADFCDSIAIIERGKLLAFGNIKEIGKKMREHRTIEFLLPQPSEAMSNLLSSDPDVVSFHDAEGHYSVNFIGGNDALIALNQKIFMAGIPVITVREEDTNLEDMFMKITTGAVN